MKIEVYLLSFQRVTVHTSLLFKKENRITFIECLLHVKYLLRRFGILCY